MELILQSLGTLAWVILHISVAEFLINRKLGISRRVFGNWIPRLNKHGFFLRWYVFWCEPISELPQRMIRNCTFHLRVQAGAVLFALLCTLVFWGLYPNQPLELFFLPLTIIEAVWLLANLAAVDRGLKQDIKNYRKFGADYVALAGYNLLTNSHHDDRPSHWPTELVRTLAEPGQTTSTASVTSTLRYTWANDIGDAEEKQAAAIEMEYALRDQSIPIESRSYVNAVYAFHLLSEDRVDEARALIKEAENDLLAGGNWMHIALAWLDVHEGRPEEAKKKLDIVWKSMADSDDMSDYVLEQSRRILPDYEPTL